MYGLFPRIIFTIPALTQHRIWLLSASRKKIARLQTICKFVRFSLDLTHSSLTKPYSVTILRENVKKIF